jgi:hypothetical protein
MYTCNSDGSLPLAGCPVDSVPGQCFSTSRFTPDRQVGLAQILLYKTEFNYEVRYSSVRHSYLLNTEEK